MKPGTAAILASVGGVMYIIGGFAAGALIAGLAGFDAGLSGNQQIARQGVSDANFLLAFGFAVGILMIIFSVVMIRSSNSKMRKIGGILVIVLSLLGAINTFGGLIIGIILAIVGGVGALTAK